MGDPNVLHDPNVLQCVVTLMRCYERPDPNALFAPMAYRAASIFCS
jgi:hypothetical protein